MTPGGPENSPAQELLQQKINSLIIPSINFNNATVEEVIRFLRQRAQALDTSAPDPQKRGVNFVLRLPDPTPADPMITMQFQDVPLLTALQLICDAANLDYTVGDTAVIISPKD